MERDIIWNEFFTTTIMWPFDFCFNGVFVPLNMGTSSLPDGAASGYLRFTIVQPPKLCEQQ